MTQAARGKARRVAMALGVSLAGMGAGGCWTTSSISPGQLPQLTESAVRDPGGGYVVKGASGERLELSGYLHMVVVERPRGEKDVFEAPIRAEMRNTHLWVWGRDYRQAYTPEQIASVRVRMTHNTGMLVWGSVLTGLGGVTTILGSTVIALTSQSIHASGIVFGLPLIVGGSGLSAGGVTLMVMGINKPDTNLPPKYRPAPLDPRVTGAGVRIQF